MSDQAFRLRTLMQTERAAFRPTSHAAPTMLAVAGGKGGVGDDAGREPGNCLGAGRPATLLVDADAQRADVTAQCGLADCPNIADVLSGLRDARSDSTRPRRTANPARPLGAGKLRRLDSPRLGIITERLTRPGPVHRRRALGRRCQHQSRVCAFWRAVDEVLLVTSPDSVAVMDAYAAVKAHANERRVLRVATIVNQAAIRSRLKTRMHAATRLSTLPGRGNTRAGIDPVRRRHTRCGGHAALRRACSTFRVRRGGVTHRGSRARLGHSIIASYGQRTRNARRNGWRHEINNTPPPRWDLAAATVCEKANHRFEITQLARPRLPISGPSFALFRLVNLERILEL